MCPRSRKIFFILVVIWELVDHLREVFVEEFWSRFPDRKLLMEASLFRRESSDEEADVDVTQFFWRVYLSVS